MSNKMLIDASHPEETRVAVVRGNRIEEFDFESQEKRQLRGNIYLAKVTRVEPSLQAAFIDYGGNRHGFLAFSEIHPDYYQIPVADRQALLEAEAQEARAMREAEEAEDDAKPDEDQEAEASANGDEEDGAEKPRSRRRRSRRKPKEDVAETSSEEGTDAPETEAPAESEAPAEDTTPAEEAASSDETEDTEEKPKKKPAPRKRTSRPRKKKADAEASQEKPEEAASSEDGSSTPDENDDSGTPTTMAAMIETDSVSEALPGEDDTPEEETASGDETEVAAEAKPKPARKRTTRTRKKTTPPKEETAEDTSSEATAEDTSDKEAPPDAAEATGDSEEDAEMPKKKAPRRRPSRRKKAADSDVAADAETAEPKNGEDASVESVGQDDAMEEVPAPRRNRRQYKIQEVVKRRQVMLIQVVKEERGNKGAALTTYLSLAGRYSVLMPNTARGGGISRKITNSSDRKRLKAIANGLDVPEGMGVILRTAGASRTGDEIERDFQYLMRLWEQVRNLTLASTAPCLVYEEGSLIKRSIRDLYDKDTGEVLVSGEAGCKEAKDFMEMLMPEHIGKVKQYKGAQAIFTKFGVESQLDSMVTPQVTLKSGGYLVINQTEALVAVDVNSGRATREHSVEKTALQTNLEAAEEVARQLRLRDLAGLIVIDFIDMEERKNNRSVEKKLKDCLKNDRARIQVGRISHFGLLEMSRQRIRASVLDSTMDQCPHCAGVGFVRSESAIALHVFRALEEHVARNSNRDAIVHTTPQIAAHMLNHKRAALVELEARYGIQVVILGNTEMSGQEFRVEKGERSKMPTSNAVDYQSDAVENNNDEDSEDGGRKKRGRRRKRSDAPETQETSSESASEETVDTAADSEGDEKAGRKRKRGRRGGRKRRDETDAVESSEAETAEAPEPAQADAQSEPEATPLEETSEADTQPKSRSTRRKKAPVSKPVEEKAEAASDPVGEEAKAEPEAEKPARATRRTTRRKKEEPVAEAVEAPATEDAASTPDAEKPEDPDADGSSEEGDGKKKRSWWRGTGFF